MRRLADVDWSRWTPHDRATLLFVIRDGEVLLIRKKRGLGAGKINAPGGRLLPGESPVQAAVREVQEEVRVVPFGLSAHGELSFQFTDGYALHCHVFRARGCHGRPEETDEAIPFWNRLDALPFAEMWADDALWLPLLVAGERFSGRFIFEADVLLDHELTRLPTAPADAEVVEP